MYPDFQVLFQSIFGTDMPAWLSIFKTFGFFVALSFIAAAWTTVMELKRKEQQGLLIPQITSITVGEPASANDLVWSAILGFILGYKIGGLFGHFAEISPNPAGYLFSMKGSLFVGIAGALGMAYSRYIEKKKEMLPEPETKKVAVYPHQRMGEILAIAAIGGIVGAKVFNAFESWDDFIKDPAGNLLSSSGLTFYGGLIVATAAFYFYARKYKISFRHLCDATAPGLMLAYGVGRLGCHFSGDGDWGKFNTAYITGPDGALRLAGAGDKFGIIHQLPRVQEAFFAAPGWLPRWMVAMNYPHNVNHEGMQIPGCTGDYCNVLPVGVFPTPVYEAVTCILLFFLLWAIRKRIKYPLHLFGIYLILNGIERFFIEKIRVNFKYDLGFIHPTQAELISVVMVLTGIGLLLFYKKKEIVSEEVKPFLDEKSS
jgi:phosphatidylglycerol:prolipoprotein diacylglycerol transferase